MLLGFLHEGVDLSLHFHVPVLLARIQDGTLYGLRYRYVPVGTITGIDDKQ